MLLSKALLPLALCLAPLAQALSNEASTLIGHTTTIAQKYEDTASSFDSWGGGLITIIPSLMSLQGLHNAQVAAIRDAKKCNTFTPEESGQIMQGIERICAATRKLHTSIAKKSPEVCATGFGYVGQAFVQIIKSDVTKFLDAMEPNMHSEHSSKFPVLHSRKDAITQEIMDSFL
ncbi:hypothetical protein MGYG_08824 [Nannizzia gypsea CBS 118893]|uniref:Cell wall galactomannoprotein n=1 Tax=Arthroderma gypseum (strain ATCC MYA-4604 / CBS 118893) TaxID=535722 RepID=E4V735_ARTGP|nr:hypothetical protein MGYG_08824 [Nannizzia gypsea CBS 118893]EFQ96901.1 hypothetical protein MGYG_08824 [Nannizzia gypsea CBS 118893]